ncbi:MAG: hypothetical protein ABUS56_12485 [Acidobacteriota bacterium]
MSTPLAHVRWRTGAFLMRGLVLALAVAPVVAPVVTTAQTIDVDPLQCWWRTSAAAVRVGEPFTLVLTCAAVETPAATVVPDQSQLESAAMHLTPFEVLGGTHGPDLHAGDRRFFQYEYRLRAIGEDLFGKDVPLPNTKITYKIRTTTGSGTANDGRDQTYFLPALSVRVLSLVPPDARDIRDAGAATFAELEARRFRSELLHAVARLLFGLAGLIALLALVRAWSTRRAPVAEADRLMSDVRVLRAVGRELGAVKRARQAEGWTTALTDRLTAALRLAAAYALRRPSGQQHVTSVTPAGHGHLIVRHQWFRGRPVRLAASITPQALADALAAAPAMGARQHTQVESLHAQLAMLTEAQFGRDTALSNTSLRNDALSDERLDGALEVGLGVVRQLTLSHTWPAKQLARLAHLAGEVRPRAWAP